jgi:predicted RNA binding protein YcfA (HicA-like mRNA interferase family)
MKPVSGRRICCILESKGWVLVRVRGSHHAFQFPEGSQMIIVPVHGNRDLKMGTQRAIMRDAGLTDEDL